MNLSVRELGCIGASLYLGEGTKERKRYFHKKHFLEIRDIIDKVFGEI